MKINYNEGFVLKHVLHFFHQIIDRLFDIYFYILIVVLLDHYK